jgi:hypothetical protein
MVISGLRAFEGGSHSASQTRVKRAYGGLLQEEAGES